jgi:hypothetical protein
MRGLFVVFSRGVVSTILIAVAGLITYFIFLAATPSDAQTGGGSTGQGNEGCANPERVQTFTGTENQITPNFNITGNTFRLRWDITDLDDDPNFDDFHIRPIGEDGIGVGQSVLVFEEGSGSENILAGPGTFHLEIESNGFRYNVTVEDCTGTSSGNQDQSTPASQDQSTPASQVQNNQQNQNGQQQNRPRRVINIPNKPLPPTGGLSVRVMVVGSVLMGAALLGLGIRVRCRQNRQGGL